MRIQKDYKNRRRTPLVSGQSEEANQMRLSGNAGSAAIPIGHSHGVISHDKAAKDRMSRQHVPNSKLGKR